MADETVVGGTPPVEKPAEAGASVLGTEAKPVAEEVKAEPTPETKAEAKPVEKADDKPADADSDAKAEVKGAPEKYEDFKIPEGFVVDDTAMNQFREKAKTMNLSQADAQALVDMQLELAKTAEEQATNDWKETIETWRTEAQNDSAIGKANWDATLGYAAKAMDQFGTPELRQMLNFTGAGNHPELIRFVSAVGKALSDDKIHMGGSGGTQPRSLEERIYTNTK